MTTILAALLCVFAAGAAESAASLLQRCAAKFTAAPSVSATFVIRSSDGENIEGTIVMARECFRISSAVLNIWYDGRTQWSALASAREVNVSEPTAEELQSSNPFAIITGYAGRYNARLLPAEKGTKLRRVELTPRRSDSDIRRAVLTIDPATGWPVRAHVVMASGADVDTTVKKCTAGKKLAASTFVYKKSDLPGYELVDLR